jgi:PKD repeat protein
VEVAEPDYKLKASATPNDPELASGHQWGLHNTGWNNGTPDADIHAVQGWDTLHDASGVIVAVIDSGIRYTHQDLAGNMWTNPNEIPDNGIDDDHNGFIDDVHGVNAIVDGGNPNDDNGHGTHVAGIIGAVGNNGVGTVGVAWKVQLMACKFLDSAGNGDTSDAIQCIDYARRNGARVMNASWGGPDSSSALYTAISNARSAGIIFVTAAGNDGMNLDSFSNYPAGYDLDNIITVCATTRDDLFDGSYSNYSPTKVDVAAPGTLIYSTWQSSDSSYTYETGTSMATPFVSGVCALLRARFPSENERQIIERILNSVDPLPSLQGKCVTGGRVNLEKALGPNPAAGFVASTLAGEPPLAITFTNTSSGDYTNLVWDFGDGSPITSEINPSHSFAYPGVFKVKLTAMGVNGRNNFVEQQIRVTPNYAVVNEPYSWIDPSTLPSYGVLTVGDNGNAVRALPFAFNFYGESFSRIYIGANGVIGLGSTNGLNSTSPALLPNRTIPNGLIAPYWDNLNPGAGGTVSFGILGESPNRKAVITWEGVPRFGSPMPFTFQAIFEEAGNDIVFQYKEVQPQNKSGGGKKASIGLEEPFGQMGVSVEYLGNPITVQNSSAYRFTQRPFSYLLVGPPDVTSFAGIAGSPISQTNVFYLYNPGNTSLSWNVDISASWIDTAPRIGTLQPGELAEVAVFPTSAAAQLGSGSFSGTLDFHNTDNSQGGGSYSINLLLSPEPRGHLEVTPPVVAGFSGGLGGPFTPDELRFVIQNSGDANLSWSASTSNQWVMLSPASGSLAPGEQIETSMTLSETAVQLPISSYEEWITFSNLDDAMQIVSFPVSIEIRGEIKPTSASLSNGEFKGDFAVQEEGEYELESSEDLVTWTQIQTITSVNFHLTFTDAVNEGTVRFYRARKL